MIKSVSAPKYVAAADLDSWRDTKERRIHTYTTSLTFAVLEEFL
jgi:hypothetical protein